MLYPSNLPCLGQFDDLTPYHTKKGVELIGATLEGTDVVVPLFNTKQQQVGSQTIKSNGQKRFNKGLKKDSGVLVLLDSLTPIIRESLGGRGLGNLSLCPYGT